MSAGWVAGWGAGRVTGGWAAGAAARAVFGAVGGGGGDAGVVAGAADAAAAGQLSVTRIQINPGGRRLRISSLHRGTCHFSGCFPSEGPAFRAHRPFPAARPPTTLASA